MSDMTPSPPSNRRRRGYHSQQGATTGNQRQNQSSSSSNPHHHHTRHNSGGSLPPGNASGTASNSGCRLPVAGSSRREPRVADNSHSLSLSGAGFGTNRPSKIPSMCASASAVSNSSGHVHSVNNNEANGGDVVVEAERNSASLGDFNDAVEAFDDGDDTEDFTLATGNSTQLLGDATNEEEEEDERDAEDLLDMAMGGAVRPRGACLSLPDVYNSLDRVDGTPESGSGIPSRKNTFDNDDGDEENEDLDDASGMEMLPAPGPSHPALLPLTLHGNNNSHSHNINDALHHPLHNAGAMARGHALGQAAVGGGGGALAGVPLYNWQATKMTLKDRFSFMFCNEILADVHFIVGRGDQRQRIPAHKFVLSVGSAVFDAMFNGAMATQSQNDPDIELPDVEAAAFIALLKFLYSDDVQIGPESVMTTLYTAKKYAVPALENNCVEFLKKNLNADNSFMLLTQARLFDEPQLAALCLETIDKHTAEALSAEGFTDIDLETLCAVLERDTLRIREAVLYFAVGRWSIEECHRQQLPVTPESQRSVLGRALALIRFPLMTVEEFAQSAAQSGILSDREVVNLFLYFTVNPKPSVNFLDVPRCCVTGKEQVVNRFQRIEGRWGYSGTPDRIKFTVDRRIFVVGFGLYGSIHGPTEYQVTIQIIHCGTGKVLGSNDTTFSCDGSSATFRVCFKEPIEISPCVTYIASACLKGPDSHYGTKGLRRIVHQSPSSGCVTFQFTYAAGNNNGTSVEDGQVQVDQ